MESDRDDVLSLNDDRESFSGFNPLMDMSPRQSKKGKSAVPKDKPPPRKRAQKVRGIKKINLLPAQLGQLDERKVQINLPFWTYPNYPNKTFLN